MDKLSDAELILRLKTLAKHKGATTKAAAELGIAPRALQGSAADARKRGLTAETVLRDPLAQAKLKVRDLEAQVKLLQKENDSAEKIRKEIWRLAEFSPEPPRWLTHKHKGSGHPGAPMTNWSDWHYGERVSLAETGGMNEYNSDIAAERIQRLADRTVRMVKGFAFKEHGKAVDFPGIVVGLGGDMISGDIHEELLATNDRTPNQCVNELTDLIAASFEQLLRDFPKIFVPCVVGNHGRTTRKPRMKGRVFTSWEWNLYMGLARYFKNNPNIHFAIPEESDCYFECMGTRFLWTHGDSLGVKGGDGIIGAIGPIMRGTLKTISAYDGIDRPVDCVVIGHWHQELWLPHCIVNNSLKGDDEFARLAMRAHHSRPSQNLWFVHPEQGITARMAVYVDDAVKPRTKPNFVSVFK